MKPRRFIAAAAFTALAGVALVGAQSQPPAPATADAQPAAQPTAKPDERAALRARLERRLDETKRLQERLEGAIKRLDGGESVEQVRTDVPEPMRRQGQGGGPGHPRGGPDGAPPPSGGPGGDHAGRPPLDRAVVMDYLKKNAPEAAQRLEDASKENPQIGERIYGRIEPQVREILGEKDADSRDLRLAEFKNGFATMAAIRAYGDTARDGKDTAAAESRLRELIGQHFDLQTRLREREIAVLETRIGNLRTEVSDRGSTRDSFITERIEKIKRGALERHKSPDAAAKQNSQK
jgi:hypothetical protein